MNKREKEILQAQLNNEKAVLKQLEEMYKESLLEINDKIAILLGRQDADLQHVIYQVQYQQALKTQVQSILENLQANEFETISEYLANAYEDGFIGTMYNLQGQGIPLIFPIDQKQVLDAIQTESNLKTTLYEAMGKDVKDLQKKIAGEISRGIAGGQMYTEIARNIAGYARIPKNNAMRIVRTEAHRIQTKATMDACNKAQSKGADVVKQWDASLDKRTRKSHARVDGEIRELDEPFSNGLQYPGDPSGKASEVINCRCAMLQRARWAVGNDFTKWGEDAPVMIDDDGTTQFHNIEAKNYDDFKKQYLKATERVRSNAQKMKGQNVLENNGKSSKIKAITIDDIKKGIAGGKIQPEVADEMDSVLEKYNARKLFSGVKQKKLGAKIVFETDPLKNGTFFDTVLNINEDVLGGLNVDAINAMMKKSGISVANSFEDAIVHEIYHAKLIYGLNYAELERLYDELNDIHIEGISKTAYKDGAECIAEVGVLIERGEIDNIPEEAMELFRKYMG